MESTRHEAETRKPYPAEKARQGEIILRTRFQRIVFLAGLAGCVLLVLLMRYLSVLG